MSHLLVWGLRQARHQTLALVDDLAEEQICLQSVPGEHHPAWVLGHILLGDVYLLALLKAQALPEEFPALLRAYGPGAPPTPSAGRYHSKQVLVDRLARTGARRLQAISALTMEDLARATPDDTLASGAANHWTPPSRIALPRGLPRGPVVFVAERSGSSPNPLEPSPS